MPIPPTPLLVRLDAAGWSGRLCGLCYFKSGIYWSSRRRGNAATAWKSTSIVVVTAGIELT